MTDAGWFCLALFLICLVPGLAIVGLLLLAWVVYRAVSS